MKLFDKEKELISKITNAIFLIWFIGAIVFTANSAIDLALKEPVSNKAEYEQRKDYDEYYKTRELLISVANVVIVGGALFVINRESKDKNEKS